MPEPTDLLRDLSDLGRSLPTPGAERMDRAVLARLEEPSRPLAARFRVRAVATGLAILVALLAAPPVRAAVADWFGFGSVVVREGDGHSGSGEPPTQPRVGAGTTLAEAADQVEFVVHELPPLGPPTGAEVSSDRRVLSLGWNGGIRLDQSSSLTYTFQKTAESFRRVSVDGRAALWFEDSHEVELLNPDGSQIPETARSAGRTLIWTIGDTTLRLEGELSLARALDLAESARRHR